MMQKPEKTRNSFFRVVKRTRGSACALRCTPVCSYPRVPLCTPVYPCVPLCTPVYPCVPLCTPVYPCAHLFTTVYPCVPLCTPVYPCVPYVPLCTPSYHCVSLFTPVYPCLPMCTPVHPCVPLCTPVRCTFLYPMCTVPLCNPVSLKKRGVSELDGGWRSSRPITSKTAFLKTGFRDIL
jgi:hypothetical protein